MHSRASSAAPWHVRSTPSPHHTRHSDRTHRRAPGPHVVLLRYLTKRSSRLRLRCFASLALHRASSFSSFLIRRFWRLTSARKRRRSARNSRATRHARKNLTKRVIAEHAWTDTRSGATHTHTQQLERTESVCMCMCMCMRVCERERQAEGEEEEEEGKEEERRNKEKRPEEY